MSLKELLSETIDSLTEDEKKILRESTPEICAQAIVELAQDPQFWREMGTKFVDGFLKGLSE